MGYCKVVGGYCSYTDDSCGLCARSSGKCIYEDDEDYCDSLDELESD